MKTFAFFLVCLLTTLKVSAETDFFAEIVNLYNLQSEKIEDFANFGNSIVVGKCFMAKDPYAHPIAFVLEHRAIDGGPLDTKHEVITFAYELNREVENLGFDQFKASNEDRWNLLMKRVIPKKDSHFFNGYSIRKDKTSDYLYLVKVVGDIFGRTQIKTACYIFQNNH